MSQIKHQTDPLTGLLSRAALDEHLQVEVQKAHKSKELLSILLLDLDHFKSVNDAFGHARGDQVLTELSARLKSTIRDSDLAFRYGGDEFLIILPNTGIQRATAIARRILEDVSSKTFRGNPPISLTISIGVACLPEDGKDAEILFEKADHRHYQAKRTGRARVCYADEDLSQSLDSQTRLIERDHPLDQFTQFLTRLDQQQRGVFQVIGPAKVGKTRLLEEVGNLAELHGYDILSLKGTPALKYRRYGALLNSLKNFGGLPSPIENPDDFTTGLKRRIEDEEKNGLLVMIDDLPYLDQATLTFWRELFFSSNFPKIAVVYTEEETKPLSNFYLEAALQNTIMLQPMTIEGVKIWLRNSLQWEPPLDFIEWFQKETQGLPGYIQKGIAELVERGALKQSEDGWKHQPDLENTPLADWLVEQVKPPATNLSTKIDQIVGRSEEVEQIKELLVEANVVTLFAPGGYGKTRLAVQVAAECLHNYKDGVFIVPLATIAEEDFIPLAIAETVQFSFSGPQNTKTQLFNYLKTKEMLLVLDNFEHLRIGSGIVSEILNNSPNVKLLVTSREILDIEGEVIFSLEGLKCPVNGNLANVERSSSIQLFLQNARLAQPDFIITEENGPDVVRICQLVEGVPLGLGLAATWVQTFSCRQIATNIENNLAFLETDKPEIPKRHRNLLAVLDSFWGLFLEPEHSVLRKLSVFQGGFTDEAAQMVAGASRFFLDALEAKKFIKNTHNGRYTIHELLRQYAADKLQSDPEDLILARDLHCKYYLGYLEARQEDLRKGRQAREEISRDIENIRAAWSWAVDHTKIDLIDQSMSALKIFYTRTSLFQEGDRVFSQTADQIRKKYKGLERTQKIKCLLGKLTLKKVHFLNGQSFYKEAISAIKKSLKLIEACHEVEAEAEGFLRWGGSLWQLEKYNEALIKLDEALSLARSANLSQIEADSLRLIGNVHTYQLNHSEGKKYFEETLQIYREIGDRFNEGITLNNLGFVSSNQKNFSKAANYYQQALPIHRELGNRFGEAITLSNLAQLTVVNPNRRIRYSEDALRIHHQIHNRRGVGVALADLAMVYFEQGKLDIANDYILRAVEIYDELNIISYKGRAMSVLGFIFTEKRELDQAAQVFNEALSLMREIKHNNLIVRILGGIADLFLLQGEALKAMTPVEEILPYIEEHKLSGIPEPFRVHLTCVRVLQANKDPRAVKILELAYKQIMEQAEMIDEVEIRGAFLENIQVHRKIIGAYENAESEQAGNI